MNSTPFIFLFITSLILSACGVVPSKTTSPTLKPTIDVSPTPTVTDDQMLQDLETDPNFNIDSSFDRLNSDL